MSEVRILLRGFVLVTAALVVSACSAHGGGGGNGSLTNPCGTGAGNADRNAPIVCVDDTGATLSVNPDPVTVHDVGQADRQPVMIHWWTRSGGGELGIEVRPGCVTKVTCRGAHCTARTLPAEASGARCKYDVWTAKHPRLDPEIIIDDCCAP